MDTLPKGEPMTWLDGAINDLDLTNLTVAVLGSHSALEVCRGARANGFRNVVVAQKGRDRTYSHHFAVRDGLGCVDETLTVTRFAELLDAPLQDALRSRNAVWIPHRSFEVYLKSDYDAIEHKFRVPMFGNRHLLRVEEREMHPNQYDLLDEAGIRHPRLFARPADIDRPVLVKVLEAERGFERAFFIARDAAEFERLAEARIADGVFTADSLEKATIEEFILGPLTNFNFFYSPLTRRLELIGTDARRQTNAAGLSTLPGFLHEAALAAAPLKYEEAGHVAVTVLESMLEMIFEAGERFVEAAARLYPPGVIGPFALQSIVTPGPPKKGFAVVDVSPRVPGSPGIAATPYSTYLHGHPVPIGDRIAMELRSAIDTDRMAEILT
jgi:5-formaminoimidazole-4-carboxamide-1-(beta)-D-ribofuranosyl 5'-monophosphate synthetase